MKVAYLRVSTQDQNLARQEELMKDRGVEILFREKASGKNADRPELQKMLDYVRAGDIVMVESYSRLARSTKDLLNLIEELTSKSVEFISLKENIDTTTPQGRLFLTISAGLVQFEREIMLERQKEGIAVAKAAGKYKGRPQKPCIDFDKWYEKVRNKETTVTEACEKMGISRSTWYTRIRKIEENTYIDLD